MSIIKNIENWFKACVPVPDRKNENSQLACCIEEFTELLQAADGKSGIATFQLKEAIGALNVLKHTVNEGAVYFKTYDKDKKKEFLDALCDVTVTAAGLAQFYGFDFSGALEEVNRSNWSKLTDGKPVFDNNGKIQKPEGYSPPDLTPFI